MQLWTGEGTQERNGGLGDDGGFISASELLEFREGEGKLDEALESHQSIDKVFVVVHFIPLHIQTNGSS